MRMTTRATPRGDRRYTVWLHDRKIGILSTIAGYTWFTLDSDYVRDPSRAVLGLRFEEDLLPQHRSNLRLTPWFSKLLHEGRLHEWIARERHVPESHETELLAEVGHDLPGAVRVTEDEEAQSPAHGARR